MVFPEPGCDNVVGCLGRGLAFDDLEDHLLVTPEGVLELKFGEHHGV